MTICKKRSLFGGAFVIGLIMITLWVFIVGPSLMVSRINRHDRRTAEWLCRLGVSPNREVWLTGSVFQCAVASSDTNIVRMMLARGADVNRLDGYGATPLQLAAESQDLGMMRLLISHGADVSRRNRDGVTVLDLATRDQLSTALLFLKELPAKTGTTN